MMQDPRPFQTPWEPGTLNKYRILNGECTGMKQHCTRIWTEASAKAALAALCALVVSLTAVFAAAGEDSSDAPAWFNRQKIRFGWGQWHRHQSEGFSVEEMMTNVQRAGITVYVDRWSHGVEFARAAHTHGMRYFGEVLVATASWKPGGITGRPAVNKLGQTHYQAREAGMNIHAGPKTLVPCPLDERVIREWFTKPCLEMIESGVVDGCHLDFESYGFTAFDRLGDYLCYCDYCFGGFTKEKVEPAQRYGWLQKRGRHREYLVNLRDRIAAIYRAEGKKLRAAKPDFVFTAYPHFSPGELENAWRTEGIARGLHEPETPFFLVDSSHYWPNHNVPWWDSDYNAVRKLGMRHVLGTWTGGILGDYPTLDTSAEQWLYDAAVSHDGHWVWFEHVWGPNDLRVQRASHRRIRVVEKAVGDFLFKGVQDHAFVTTVEQSGDPELDANVISRTYHLDPRHLVRIANVHADRPLEVCVRFPRLEEESRWTVADPLSNICYTNPDAKTRWSTEQLRAGVWLSMEKRSDLWLVLAPAVDDLDVDPSTTVSGAVMKGHKKRPPTGEAIPTGVKAPRDFPLAYVKTNPLEYYGTSAPSINPVLGSSIHFIDAADGSATDKRLFAIDGSAWSPALSLDRSLIAFSSYINGRGQIHSMNSDGSSVFSVSGNDFCDKTPSWSPDGKRIAFVSDRDGDWEIYAMNADGSDVRRLTKSPGIDRNPAWSPDGSELAFESDRAGDFDIFLMNVDGTDERALVSRSRNEYEPTWSPDGKRLACTVGMYGYHRDVMVVNVEDGSVEHPKGIAYIAKDWWPFYNVTSIAWSPDGKTIAGAFEKPQESGVFSVNVDGTELRELVVRGPLKIYPGGDVPRYQMIGGWYWNGSASRRWLLHAFKDVRWSPQGKSLAFTSDMDPSGYFFIHTVSAEGGPVTRLDATISPAGKNNKPIPIRAESGEKKTSGFADTLPGKARYFDGSAYDRMIKDLVDLAPLPVDGWAFKDNSPGAGVEQGYFKPDFDMKNSPTLRIDKFWDAQGFKGLSQGWYRQRWTCPELPPGKRLFVHVGAVDESVWLYIDGRLAAWYDAADPAQTWDKPLLLEVSGSLQSAREHLLVFRVKNIAGAGGVWKPVSLMVEK